MQMLAIYAVIVSVVNVLHLAATKNTDFKKLEHE